VRGARQDGELGGRQFDEIARHAAAEEPEHLDGVLGPNEVGVADDQQGRHRQRGEPFLRHGDASAVELVDLGDEAGPRRRVRGHGPVGVVPRRAVELVGIERLEARHQLGVQAARVERGAAREHEVVDEVGTIEGQLQPDGASHAVPHDVGALDVEGREQAGDVAGHAFVAQWSSHVARVAVALQLDGDHLEVIGEGGQQAGEAALDRPHGAVEQDERVPLAMAFVVQVELADVDVARRVQRRHDWLRYAR
jgi:hypothetical protein